MKIEDVLIKTRPARRSFFVDYAMIFVLLGTAYFVWKTNILNPVTLYGIIGVIAIILIYIEIIRFSNTYYITKHQLIKRSGIISKKIESIFLRNISEINLSQNAFQRVLRYGDIIINSRAANQISFKKISEPKKIIRKIEKLMKYEHA